MTHLHRPGGRAPEELRPVSIELGPMKYAEGSALITLGDTRVLVAASIENVVPPFLRDKGQGWLTAEYSMLPRATLTRSPREVARGRVSGRTSEIQRLIGRSLRAALDLSALGERTLTLDCDVLQADGGTRTAAITGAWVAAVAAVAKLLFQGEIERWPIVEQVAAVSVGLASGAPVLDLEYAEDQSAAVDMNVVGTARGTFVEVQGTGEGTTFTRDQLDRFLELASLGISQLLAVQNQTLATVLEEVAEARRRPRRQPAKPRNEAELWGRP